MKQKFTKHIENLKDEVLDELKTFIPMGTFVNFTNLCDYIDTCHCLSLKEERDSIPFD